MCRSLHIYNCLDFKTKFYRQVSSLKTYAIINFVKELLGQGTHYRHLLRRQDQSNFSVKNYLCLQKVNSFSVFPVNDHGNICIT